MDPILDRLPCGYLSVDETGIVLACNRTLAELLGVPVETVAGRAMDELLSAAGKIFFSTHLFPLLRLHGRADEVYVPFRRADGESLPVLVNGVARPDDNRSVYDLIVVAMQQRNELENELLAARRVAEQAASAKDRFLSVVSHELRTPISAVHGYAELLLRERAGPLTDGQRRYAERIRDSASYQATLIDDILDFARQTGELRTLEPELVEVEQTVERATALLVVRAREARLALRREPVPAPGRVRADPRALQQILLNLGSNAIKFSPPGADVRMLVEADEAHVRIAVRDAGPGIAAEDQARIFEPFVQLVPRPAAEEGMRGVGLGLAISRDLARAMGGDIHLVSAPGRGSTFTLELPAAASL